MSASKDLAEEEVGVGLEKKEGSKKTELIQLISVEQWNNDKIIALVPEWGRLVGENGYRHNGENLGEHTQTVIKEARKIAKENGLSNTEVDLVILASFFHDFGQNTGKKDEVVERKYDHENKSVEVMRRYAKEWGVDEEEILKVEKVILLDGIVSDIARGKVRSNEKNLSVVQFAEKLGGDVETLGILRAVNKADVLATVGESGWAGIRIKYEKYFDDAELIINGEEKAKEMETRVEKKFSQIDLGDEVGPLKKLYLDAMEVVDKVRFAPFLGIKDAETMAGFTRIMRGENCPFEVNRYLGVGYGVDKSGRDRFLSFVRKHNSTEITLLTRAVGNDSTNAIFTYGFDQEEDGLERLLNDPELIDLALKISGVVDFDQVGSAYTIADRSRYEKIRALKECVYGEDLLKDRGLLSKIEEETVYFYSEILGSAMLLPKFPRAMEYMENGGKIISAVVLPVFELASLDPQVFDVAKTYVEHTGSVGVPDFVKVVAEAIEQADDNSLKMLLEIAAGNIDEGIRVFGQSSVGLSLLEKNIRGVSLLAAELKKQPLSDELAEAYLNSFPFRTMGDDEIGYVIRGSEKLLGRLAQVNDAQRAAELLTVFEKKGFFAMLLADGLMDGGVGTFEEALVKAGEKLEELGNLDGFDSVTWKHVGQNVSRNPKKLQEILEMLVLDDVRQVILPGGLLFDSQGVFFESVFESSDVKANALRIAQQFLNPETTYAEKVYFYALNSNLESLDVRAPMVLVKYREGLADLRALSLEEKKEVLRMTIEKEVEMSVSKEVKAEADERNRRIKPQDQLLVDGVRLHGTFEASLPAILRAGNLAGECIVRSNVVDSFPFCVDYAAVTKKDITKGKSTFAGIFSSISEKSNRYFGGYFDNGVTLIMTSNPESESVAVEDGHVLKFAAERATNIQGIILTRRYQVPEVVSDMKMLIAENGFYIPIYNPTGELLFEPEEYDRLRSENHLDIELEYWDESLEVGGKRGSNPGGLYSVPSTGGVENYYAKFLGNRDRIWNEWLANRMYAEFGVAVPEVTVRNVGGRLAVTSKWIDSVSDVVGALGDINSGFIMDAWLANWDIPWAIDANTKEMDGGRVRLDNGGAILFRANAGMKDLDGGNAPFTNEVVELTNYGTGKHDGSGMMAQYPNLTDDEVRDQALRLGDIFTDLKISELVEQTQISPELRKILIERLIGRRNYILKSVGLSS